MVSSIEMFQVRIAVKGGDQKIYQDHKNAGRVVREDSLKLFVKCNSVSFYAVQETTLLPIGRIYRRLKLNDKNAKQNK
jgi:hypothetical protein